MQTRTWISLTLGIAIVAEVLQLAGFVAPLWIWLDVDTFTAGVGLWFSTGCGIDGDCQGTAPTVSFSYSPEKLYDSSKFQAVQALETVGLCGGVLVVLFLVLYRMGYGAWRMLRELHIALLVICILTWLCVLIGVMVYCGSYWPVVGTSPLLSRASFPWSVLLCLVAGIMFVVISVLVHTKCWASQFVKHAIPVSGNSQMDLHPVTKTGYTTRYFTPAYHETRRPNHAIVAPEDEMHGPGPSMLGGAMERTQRSVGGFDNMAFQGNALETGFDYSYVPPPRTVDMGTSIGASFRPESTLLRPPPSRLMLPPPEHPSLSPAQRSPLLPPAPISPLLSPIQNSPLIPAAPRPQQSIQRPVIITTTIPNGTVYRSGDLAPDYNRGSDDLVPDYHDSGPVRQDPPLDTSTRFKRQESTSLVPARDVTGYYNYSNTVGGGVGVGGESVVERDVTHITPYVVSVRRNSPLMPPLGGQSIAGTTMLRESSIRQEGNVRGPYVTHLDVAWSPHAGIGTSSGAYVAGVSELDEERRKLLMKDNTLDTRFTQDGRMTAGANFLTADYRGTGERAMSVAGSSHSHRSNLSRSNLSNRSARSALLSATHLGPVEPETASQSVWSASGGPSTLFKPNYIYRPPYQQAY